MEFLNPNMKYVNITPENTQLYYTGINPTEECAAIKYNIIDYAINNINSIDGENVLEIDIQLQNTPIEVIHACFDAVDEINERYETDLYKYRFSNDKYGCFIERINKFNINDLKK